MGGGDDVSVAGAALRRAAVARFATAHPGELIVASGAFAYALGYINLRLAGAGLGVAPADLALSTHDHVMSATVWVIVISPVLFGAVWLDRKAREVEWRSRTFLFPAIGALAGACVAVAMVATVAPLGAFVMVVVIGVAVAGGRWFGGKYVGVLLAFAATWFGVSFVNSYQWGHELKEHPATVAAAPPYLGIVLAVEEGTAEFSTGAECARRVSDRIYVTADGVRVEPGVPFKPEECFSTP
jgi:hypothetical protein